jgi:hypothetical protein
MQQTVIAGQPAKLNKRREIRMTAAIQTVRLSRAENYGYLAPL